MLLRDPQDSGWTSSDERITNAKGHGTFRCEAYELLIVEAFKQLCSRVSACLPGHPRIPLNVRHTMMNEFRGPEDGSFILVSSQLKEIARNGRIDQAQTGLERECLQSLTSNYIEDKNRIEQRVPGTCNWFLKHPKYLDWYQQTISSLLYVSADPGCGKTVLSRALIDDGLLSPDIRTPSICYFFFKDDDISRQSGAIALCAILHQLFIQKPALLKYAMFDFQNHGTRLQTMFNILWDILEKSVADEEAGEVICVFDALDECEEIAQKELIRRLGQFHSSQRKMVTKSKFIVTSRPYYGIGRAFRSTIKDMASISVKGEDEWETISKEIDLVIDDQIPRISSAREVPFAPEVQDVLIKHLKEIPHRTYLWLYLMLNAIRESLDSTAFRLERLISKLPRSIEDAYEKILRKVDNDSERAQEARTLLHIVTAAVRPLTIQEMNLALAIDEKVRRGQPCQSYYDLDVESEEAFAEKVRNLCGLFVTVVNAKIYLIHQTAKEFLVAKQDVLATPSSEVWKHSLKPVESNSVISKICLYYLLLDEIDDEIGDEIDDDIGNKIDDESGDGIDVEIDFESYTIYDRLHFVGDDGPEYSFLSYVGENWCAHFREAKIEGNDAVMRLVLDLFDTQSNKFRRWIQVYLNSHPSFRNIHRSRRFTSLTSASYVGVPAAVKLLLKQDDAKLQAEDKDVAASLRWAILGEHIDVVEILLKQNRSLVNDRHKNYTPLSNAVALGSPKMTRFLLKQEDIDPNLGDSRGRTPLFLAAGYGDLEMVEELLRKDGINLNSKDNHHRTPLLWAAAQGQTKVVDSLLRNPDIESNCRDENGRTPLLWAAVQGHSKVVDSLLRTPDIEPNCRDENGRTPLLWAAVQRYSEVVKSLLSNPGVEPDYTDETGRTPLSWAAAQGQSEVVDLLLRNPSVKPDYRDENGQKPLSWAASQGKHWVVERLLSQEAIDVNSKDDWDQTPLSWAVQAGSLQTVRLLLAQKGIDPYSKNKEGRKAMSWVTKKGYSQVVELLIRRDSTDPDFGNKMAQAMFLWSVSAESLSRSFMYLFTTYKDVDSSGSYDHSVFGSALKMGDMDLIKFLLEYFEAVNFQSEGNLFKDRLSEDKGIQAIFDSNAGKGLFKAAEIVKEAALDLSFQLDHWSRLDDCNPHVSQFREKLIKLVEEVSQAAGKAESGDKILSRAYEKMSRAAQVMLDLAPAYSTCSIREQMR